MRRQLLPALGMVAVFTVITGLAYPLLVTGIAQVAFGDMADGSLAEVDGQVVGSTLIGQPFAEPGYFHPRPPGVSNHGPTNPELIAAVRERVAAYQAENGLDADTAVPVDAVTASGSGLDPHISIANARIQAERVAEARGLDLDAVLALVEQHTDGRDLGFLGEPGVNVLTLNLALDAVP